MGLVFPAVTPYARKFVVDALRQRGLDILALEDEYHRPSAGANVLLGATVGFSVELLRIVLEGQGWRRTSAAISGLNGGPGLIGVGIDLARLPAAEGTQEHPIADEQSLIPRTRLLLAASAGAVLGFGMIPDPEIRHSGMALAAMRRSTVDSIHYAVYGRQLVNHHVAMLTEAALTYARAYLPAWGNPVPTDGDTGWERVLNGTSDVAFEVAWQAVAAAAATAASVALDDYRGAQFLDYTRQQMIPSLVPPAVLNLYAQPVRPVPEALQTLRAASHEAGISFDPLLTDRLTFRRKTFDGFSTAQIFVPVFIDFRPSFMLSSRVADFFLEDTIHQFFDPTTLRFSTDTVAPVARCLAHNNVLTGLHELTHLGAMYGFAGRTPLGHWRPYGGQGPVVHAAEYFWSRLRYADPVHNPGEIVEYQWQYGWGNGWKLCY